MYGFQLKQCGIPSRKSMEKEKGDQAGLDDNTKTELSSVCVRGTP